MGVDENFDRTTLMNDDFKMHQAGLTAPASAGQTLVADDNAPLEYVTRALYVGTGGNLRVTLLSGDVVTLNAVAAGTIYPLRITHLHATGTSAADIVGLR